MQFEAMLVLFFATLPTQGWQNSLAVRWRVGKHAMALLHALGRRAGSRGDQRLGVAPTFDAGSRVLLRTWRWACARVCLPLLQTPRPPPPTTPPPAQIPVILSLFARVPTRGIHYTAIPSPLFAPFLRLSPFLKTLPAPSCVFFLHENLHLYGLETILYLTDPRSEEYFRLSKFSVSCFDLLRAESPPPPPSLVPPTSCPSHGLLEDIALYPLCK